MKRRIAKGTTRNRTMQFSWPLPVCIIRYSSQSWTMRHYGGQVAYRSHCLPNGARFPLLATSLAPTLASGLNLQVPVVEPRAQAGSARNANLTLHPLESQESYCRRHAWRWVRIGSLLEPARWRTMELASGPCPLRGEVFRPGPILPWKLRCANLWHNEQSNPS